MSRERPHSSASPLVAGMRIGRYELLEELGSGGMGVVFRARDCELDREVALKSPHLDLVTDPVQRRRFLREARLTSRLSHPHIVPILDSLEHDGRPWIALQLVVGESLAERLQRTGRLSPRRAAAWAEDLADALAVSHGQGVLHRDVNPRNVLVTQDDRVLLTDFGLARLLEAERASTEGTTRSAATAEGAVVGTPRYMSPEQALGKPLDERSDLFSLAVVLYEMLTGQPAFASTPEGGVLDAIIHHEPEPIARFTYEVPPEFEQIIRKAMAKDPEERYPDARALLVDLRALRRRLDAEAYSGTHPGWKSPASSRARRGRVLRVAAWGAVAVAAAATWLVLRSRDAPLPVGRPVQITSSPGWEGAPALSPDGGRVAYCALTDGNYDIWVVGARGGEALRLTSDPGADRAPAWYPDGSAIAFTSDRTGALAIWKVGQLGGSATLLVADADYPAVSPDGSRLAFARANVAGIYRIVVAPLDHPAATTVLTGDDGGLWSHRHPAWSPDGKWLAYASQDKVWRVDAAGGTPTLLASDTAFDAHPAWSPSGRYVYYTSSSDGVAAIWRVAPPDGTPERVTTGSHESWPSTGRTGERIAYATATESNDVVVRDLARGTEVTLASALDDMMPTLAPDGSAVVFVSRRQGAKYELWRQRLVAGAPDGDPVRLTDQPGNSSHPAYSPDGRWIAYYQILAGQRDIWVVPAAGGEAVGITNDAAPDYQPAWTPDGRGLVFLCERGGRARVWCVAFADGRAVGEMRPLTPDSLEVRAFALSPDGREIAVADAGNGSELVLMAVGGEGPRHRLLPGTVVDRMRWDVSSGDLFVAAWWGAGERAVVRVSSVTGARLERVVSLGGESVVPVFDISADGRLIAFSRGEERGDVWVLEAQRGKF
jgi:eukaryotic-like serine/threonine-protein kinase